MAIKYVAKTINWPFKVGDIEPISIECWEITGRPETWETAINAAWNYSMIAKDLYSFDNQSSANSSYKEDTTAIARREKLITLLEHFYCGIKAFYLSRGFYDYQLDRALTAYMLALVQCTGRDGNKISYSGGLDPEKPVIPNESVLELFLYLKCASLEEKPQTLSMSKLLRFFTG